MQFLRNIEECNLNKKVWCEGGLRLSYSGTKNGREYQLNPRLGYDTEEFVETQSSVHHSTEISNLRYSEVNRKARCNLLANSMRLHSKLDLKFNL